jgi:hypothetical protein
LLLRYYIGDMLIMIRRLPLLAVALLGSLVASAQTPSIVGTWDLIGADKILPDGTRTSDYGTHPHGLVVFTADGHYAVQICREERQKFSTPDSRKGTPEDYKEAFLSMSVHFGRYKVDADKHTITFEIDRALFPNWDNTTQVRAYELKDDELSWRVPPRPDGSIPLTVLRRIRLPQ